MCPGHTRHASGRSRSTPDENASSRRRVSCSTTKRAKRFPSTPSRDGVDGKRFALFVVEQLTRRRDDAFSSGVDLLLPLACLVWPGHIPPELISLDWLSSLAVRPV